MTRKAFVMSVHPDCEMEHENRHRPIWPELEAVLKAHGVHNYSIFLDTPTRTLFAYAEIEDEDRWAAIAATSECQKWWRHMGTSCHPIPITAPSHGDYARSFISTDSRQVQSARIRKQNRWPILWPAEIDGKPLSCGFMLKGQAVL